VASSYFSETRLAGKRFPWSQPNLPDVTRLFLLLLTSLLLSAHAMGAVGFEQQILPFLNKKCIDCHRAPYEENGKKKEPKAGLRLDAAWAIVKGSENGPVLTAGAPEKSGIYESVMLPKDDDAHMPPKGDDLTKEEVALLKKWIEEGADFGGWVGNTEGMPAGAATQAQREFKPREHDVFFAKLEKEVKPLGDAVLDAAKKAGAQISPVKVESPLVRVDFLTGVSKCDDAKVESILPLKENVVALDLGRTIITDAALKSIGQLPRLVTLDLRQTKVGDAGLESLTRLSNLHTLNLYGTQVTDEGLKHLAKIKSLKNIYLWQSKATKVGVKQLVAALPGVKVSIE
jgi:hypothetical protein